MDGFGEVIVSILVGVVTAVVATAFTFHFKDYLEERAKFKKFKEVGKDCGQKCYCYYSQYGSSQNS